MAAKPTYDRERVTYLRSEVVENCILVLTDSPKVKKWSQYKKEMMLKLSSRVLPTLNEHSGPEGKPIPILNVIPKNHSDAEDTETE